MVEVHPGLLKLDYIQYLVRNNRSASPESFRSFTLSDREHRFKGWHVPQALGRLKSCLHCGVEHSPENPITADHMIPQVLTKYSDPIRSRLKAVVAGSENLFSVCQSCHSQIDQYKIPTLGVDLPQNPARLFDFLAQWYPITTGRHRLRMLETAQKVIDKYIDIIEDYLSRATYQTDPRTEPFRDSLPKAYEFSGLLFRQARELQAELDAKQAHLVQSSS